MASATNLGRRRGPFSFRRALLARFPVRGRSQHRLDAAEQAAGGPSRLYGSSVTSIATSGGLFSVGDEATGRFNSTVAGRVQTSKSESAAG